MGVVEGARRARLELEATQEIGGLCRRAGDDLHRHVAADALVARAEDLAHAAAADAGEDLVSTEARPGADPGEGRDAWPGHGRGDQTGVDPPAALVAAFQVGVDLEDARGGELSGDIGSQRGMVQV